MSGLFGRFEAVAQIDGAVPDRVARSQHRSGTLTHRRVLSSCDHRVIIQSGPPRIQLGTEAQADQEARATITTRLLVHVRPEDDPFGPWRSTIGHLEQEVRVAWIGTDPADLRASPVLQFEREDLAVGGIELDDPDQAMTEIVTTALTQELTGLVPVRTTVPTFALFDKDVSWASFHFLARADGSPALAVGLHLGTATGGVRADLQTVALAGDWLAGVDADTVEAAVRAAVAEELGGQLPTPTVPVVLDTHEVCLVGTDDFCLDLATETISLTGLDVTSTDGALILAGQLLRQVDRFYVPDLTAHFMVEITATLDDDGQVELTASVGEVAVEEWYGQLLDVFTGGGIAEAVEAGVAEAIGGTTWDADLLGTDVLAQAAALHPSVETTFPIEEAEIRADGILLHGRVDVANQRALPVADVRVAALDAESGQAVLDASRSWAPGGDVVDVTWTVTNGKLSGSASDRWLVATAEDLAPDARVCVTVADDLGRSAQACVDIRPDHLSIEHLPGAGLRAWLDVIGQPVQFLVRDSVGPRVGATVVIGASGQRVRATTDTRGVAKVALPPEWLADRGRPEALVAEVSATLGGRASPSRAITLVDGARRGQLLKIVADRVARTGPDPGRAASILSYLVAQVAAGPMEPDAALLLGLDPDRQTDGLLDRLRTLEQAGRQDNSEDEEATDV